MTTADAAQTARARVREEFIDAAYRVIDTDGPRPSMDAIARAAGGSKPRLYRQFADKHELYTAIAQRMREDIYRRVLPDFNFALQSPMRSLRHAITGYAEEIGGHPNVFRFLVLGSSTPSGEPGSFPLDIGRELAQRMQDLATAMLEAVHVDSSGIDYTAQAAVGSIVACTDLWLSKTPEDEPPPVQTFVDEVSDLVWGIIAAFLRRHKLDVDPDEPMFVALTRAQESAAKK
ncbi:TetR/AcrR family transcriptional regulator [Skermania sp. ID1734]|uniref:TetR/AcrR family transcriptional regulator n=1 Tax=Skermania sp. ID1734 TaxID=2597516 RepID=UPI0021042870|nr:TetR/AcrR family transcriptional regulator [Skermania sp. ID1734]